MELSSSSRGEPSVLGWGVKSSGAMGMGFSQVMLPCSLPISN